MFLPEDNPNDTFGLALGRIFYKKLGAQPLLVDQRGQQRPIKDGYFFLPKDIPMQWNGLPVLEVH